ncbi:MAG: hypothetical protein ACI9SC_002757, partial [Gammaproteobacteria bacterium]
PRQSVVTIDISDGVHGRSFHPIMMPARRYKVKPPEKPKSQQGEMELHSAILSKCQVNYGK